MGGSTAVRVVDSHTEGEPTRVVTEGGPDLGEGSLSERLDLCRQQFDSFRSAVVGEPRGSDVLVGALLLPPVQTSSATAVIFFNDVGYLGMCGHGTIGVVQTLAYLGRITPGLHAIETPVGTVSACLDPGGDVTVSNVPSYRLRKAATVSVPGLGEIVGDVAWGGNWFFLVKNHPFHLAPQNRVALTQACTAIREALAASGLTGTDGAPVDHIELISPPHNPQNSARNFVLCPGAAFDRSPCGTGTSAKMACLAADGELVEGQLWRQEGILDTVFEGSITRGQSGEVYPHIRGRAWITGEATLHFDAHDPLRRGIRW